MDLPLGLFFLLVKYNAGLSNLPNLEAGRHHKIYRFSELYSELYPSISFGDKFPMISCRVFFDHELLLFLVGVIFLEVFTVMDFIVSLLD